MNDKPLPPQPNTERAAYRTPKLVRYGRLASLVQGGSLPINFEDGTYLLISAGS